ncbi:MAG: DNA-directed RNA polymerase subunit omega [Candidatus Aminicenantales bacterium]
MKPYGDIDSKFRFVILASKRAKELLRGAKPKIETNSKNPIRIAQLEVAKNLVDYEIIQPEEEEAPEVKKEELSEKERKSEKEKEKAEKVDLKNTEEAEK